MSDIGVCKFCGRPLTHERPRPVGFCNGYTVWYANEPRCLSDKYVLRKSDPRYATAFDGRPLEKWRA